MTPQKPGMFQLTERGHKVFGCLVALLVVGAFVLLLLIISPKAGATEVPNGHDRQHTTAPVAGWDKPCDTHRLPKPKPSHSHSKGPTWTSSHSPTSGSSSSDSPSASPSDSGSTSSPAPSTTLDTPTSSPSSGPVSSSASGSPSTQGSTSPSSAATSSTSAISPTSSAPVAPTTSGSILPAPVLVVVPPLSIERSLAEVSPVGGATPSDQAVAPPDSNLASTGAPLVAYLLGLGGLLLLVGSPFVFIFGPSKRRTR